MAKYADATPEGFTEYHEARGRIIPEMWDDDIINVALLVASEWIDGTYGPSFVGRKTGGFTQVREWPRIGAVANSVDAYAFSDTQIPSQLISAVYEAAFREATSNGSLLVDYTPGKYKSVSIDGALSVEYVGFTSAAQLQKTYPIIDRLMEPLLYIYGSAQYSSMSGRAVRT